MVKTCDLEIAEEYGIDVQPALVYFENGIPFLYPGMYHTTMLQNLSKCEVKA